MPTDRQQRLQEALDAVVARPGVLGAFIVTRDGFALLHRAAALPAPETFSAMTATMLGAAEAALAEVGGDGAARIVVEARDRRVVIVGATDELLLVGVCEARVAADELATLLRSTAEAVAKIAAG